MNETAKANEAWVAEIQDIIAEEYGERELEGEHCTRASDQVARWLEVLGYSLEQLQEDPEVRRDAYNAYLFGKWLCGQDPEPCGA